MTLLPNNPFNLSNTAVGSIKYLMLDKVPGVPAYVAEVRVIAAFVRRLRRVQVFKGEFVDQAGIQQRIAWTAWGMTSAGWGRAFHTRASAELALETALAPRSTK